MSEQTEATELDPRTSLAEWANANDEWVRAVVREVLATGKPLNEPGVDGIYELFCQEKGLNERTCDPELPSRSSLE